MIVRLKNFNFITINLKSEKNYFIKVIAVINIDFILNFDFKQILEDLLHSIINFIIVLAEIRTLNYFNFNYPFIKPHSL